MLQKALKESEAIFSVAVRLGHFLMILGHIYVYFPHCSSRTLSLTVM